MGIGHGRLGAAAPVAGRPRVGPGTQRSDAQHTALVNPDQAAATGADRVDIEHRRADRQIIDVEFVGDPGRAVLDQANVGAGPAHVEGDQVL